MLLKIFFASFVVLVAVILWAPGPHARGRAAVDQAIQRDQALASFVNSGQPQQCEEAVPLPEFTPPHHASVHLPPLRTFVHRPSWASHIRLHVLGLHRELMHKHPTRHRGLAS